MSSDQHLSEAKRLISATAKSEDIGLAERHLKEVLKQDPANKEAQALYAQANARFREIRDASVNTVASNDSGLTFTPAEKFAMDLERNYKNNGYDIDAHMDIDKTLVVKSDIFQDASMRETEATELWNQRGTLCSMEIWYVKVGYSKGVLSGDIMKTVALGCLAQKAAYEKEMAPEREKVAANLSVEGMQASVAGTTLRVESDFFSEETFRKQFQQRILANPDIHQKVCRSAFTQVQMTYKGKVVRTVPLKCD